jgi:hypothetical protein
VQGDNEVLPGANALENSKKEDNESENSSPTGGLPLFDTHSGGFPEDVPEGVRTREEQENSNEPSLTSFKMTSVAPGSESESRGNEGAAQSRARAIASHSEKAGGHVEAAGDASGDVEMRESDKIVGQEEEVAGRNVHGKEQRWHADGHASSHALQGTNRPASE